MGLLSFLRREPAPPTPSRRGKKTAGSDGLETLQRLRQQARRRLLGAAVLVGIGIVAFPLVFETQPRPVPMDLPIVIPAKEAAPTAPAPTQAALPASLPEDAEVQAVAESASLPEPAAPPPARSSEPLPAKPQPEAPAVAESPRPAASAATARYVVQVGAFADKQAALQARQKLERKGLKTYAQVAKTPQGERIRVRLGPFASRADADKAARQAKAVGLAGAVLTL